MSHPKPSHDRENEYKSDDGPKGRALSKAKKVKPFSGGIKGLKEMMNQPASKHWFARK